MRTILWLLALPLLAGCGLRGGPPPADPVLDARIRERVAARLQAEPALEADAIRVVVEGAVVQLHGRVRGIGAWQCAITNAQLVPGVQSVADYLVLDRGPRDVRCLAPRPDSAVVAGGP